MMRFGLILRGLAQLFRVAAFADRWFRNRPRERNLAGRAFVFAAGRPNGGATPRRRAPQRTQIETAHATGSRNGRVEVEPWTRSAPSAMVEAAEPLPPT